MTLTKRGRTWATLLVFGGVLVVGATAWDMPAAGMSLPACAQEDDRPAAGAGCSWDATKRGNGLGTSFYVTGSVAEVCWHYPSRTLPDGCEPR